MIYFISTTVHGNWGRWVDWAQCSKSCEGGIRTRIRLCNNPSPLYSGRQCNGSVLEEEVCNDIQCPGKYIDVCNSFYFYLDRGGNGFGRTFKKKVVKSFIVIFANVISFEKGYFEFQIANYNSSIRFL